MSTFIQTCLTGTTLDANQLAGHLQNDLPTAFDIASAASLGTIVGTTFVDVAIKTGVAVLADECVDVFAHCNFSGSTNGDLVEFGLFVNGSKVTTDFQMIHDASTSSQRMTVALRWISENLSGSIDFKLQGRVATGAGGLWVGQREIMVLRHKKR